MNFKLTLFSITTVLLSCTTSTKEKETTVAAMPIEGNWELVSGTMIDKGDTTNTDYRKNQRMIKILTASRFAFLQHDLTKGKDSTAVFGAGGGTYTLVGDQYTENLEFCNAREWEDKSFHFTVTISNDTLIQQGVEKVEATGTDRYITERYVRIK